MEPSTIRIRGLSGELIKPKGEVSLKCMYRNVTHVIVFQVVDGNAPNLLGDEDSVRMGLIQRVHSIRASGIEKVSEGTTKENGDQKMRYGTREEFLRAYDDVFTGIGTIPGEYRIDVDEAVEPVVHPPRTVPAAIRGRVKEELDRLGSLGIIQQTRDPTEWVSSMVTVTKGEKVRICIDPKDLNRAVKRSHYPMTKIEDVITRTGDSRVFGTLDYSQGFFQIALDEGSRRVTCFNTPWGRYSYRRLPMGIKSSPEIYHRAMIDMFGDLDGVEIVIDDILIHAKTEDEFDRRLLTVLDRCRLNGLKLNAAKTKLGMTEVGWIGHKNTSEGVQIADDKIRAVLDMPTPQTKDDIKRFLGILNFLGKFIPNQSEVTAPLRDVLEKTVSFFWGDTQERAFADCKEKITTAPVLRYYSLTEPVVVSCDASSRGLGAVLLQGDRPVVYASKALTDAEQRYAQIEKELLAIVFATNAFHLLIYGRQDVTVETDHKPLESIWSKPLVKAPMRLQKMMLKLQPYSMEVVYTKGKDIPIPDALSRLYVPQQGDKLIDHEAMVTVAEVCFSPDRQPELAQATLADPVLQELTKLVKEGWPAERCQIPGEHRPYWDFRDGIVLDGDILIRGDRVIIPESMRKHILSIIHEAPLGIEKCKRRAREAVYWPSMGKQIEDVVAKCGICQSMRKKQQKETLYPHEVPSRPWAKVAADVFTLDSKLYLLMIDYYWEFFEVQEVENTRTPTIVRVMR